jgi:hypothetical protein
MHLEILVEDASGQRALENLIPKVIASEHTFTIHRYKGVGRIPPNMKDPRDASKRMLLDNLPKLLKGFGRTFNGYGRDYNAAVLVVCDLDSNDLDTFLKELNRVLHSCYPKPQTRFLLAIEEGEAWLLGDIPAVLSAYPKADRTVLLSYINDSICGTWEKLADALYPGGSTALRKKGHHAVGAEKMRWATEITPGMNVENNRSPSFAFFCKEVRALVDKK